MPLLTDHPHDSGEIPALPLRPAAPRRQHATPTTDWLLPLRRALPAGWLRFPLKPSSDESYRGRHRMGPQHKDGA